MLDQYDVESFDRVVAFVFVTSEPVPLSDVEAAGEGIPELIVFASPT